MFWTHPPSFVWATRRQLAIFLLFRRSQWPQVTARGATLMTERVRGEQRGQSQPAKTPSAAEKGRLRGEKGEGRKETARQSARSEPNEPISARARPAMATGRPPSKKSNWKATFRFSQRSEVEAAPLSSTRSDAAPAMEMEDPRNPSRVGFPHMLRSGPLLVFFDPTSPADQFRLDIDPLSRSSGLLPRFPAGFSR